jgi:hypothetical protein
MTCEHTFSEEVMKMIDFFGNQKIQCKQKVRCSVCKKTFTISEALKVIVADGVKTE